MGIRNVVDVSSFMLFEATGDSEVDCNPIPLDGFGCEQDDGTSTSAMDDNEDAESCCFGLVESYHEDSCGILDDERNVNGKAEDKYGTANGLIVNKEENGIRHETWYQYHCKFNDGDDMQKHQKSTASVDSSERWNRRDDDMQRHQKSTVSVDSTDQDLANEIEQNRLFWETCLAS